MLRPPARDGGCIATGSVPCASSPRWTQGRGREPGTGGGGMGAVKSRSPRDRDAESPRRPEALPTPGVFRGTNPGTHSLLQPCPNGGLAGLGCLG